MRTALPLWKLRSEWRNERHSQGGRNMSRIPIAIALIIALSPAVLSQVPTGTAQTTESTSRINQLSAPWDKPDSPGCALGVIKDGKMIFKKGYGMANLE